MTERLMEDKTVNNVDNEENEIKLDPKRQSTIIKIFSIGFILLIISIIIFFLLRNQIKVLNDGKNINRPLIDNKDYIFYELTNKMKVALISDKKTKISGGSLTVKAGSFYDLIVGLAIYSSRMILAGSEKYGNDTDTFIDKIKEMEGVNIINTLNNMTIYSFHVYNEGFIKILDIFASILDKPKLAINNNNDTLKDELEKYMSSNVEAIDSEFYATNNSKYLLKQVFKDLAHKNHPYHNSTLGKIETLREKMNKKTNDENKRNNYTLLLLSDVKSYFDTFYKTKDMTLVLYSNLSLKEMKKELQSKFTFDAHSSLSSETFLFKQKFEQLKKEPYSKDNLNMFALYRSNNWNNIHFSFYFSQSNPNIKIALEYFKFIFFSREYKTLINTLMNNEIFEYIIDESDIGYSNFNIFSFRLLLNRKSNKTIFINVINDVYSYIEKISQNINKDLYNNLKDIYEFNFKTQENTKDIAKLTSTLSNKLFSGDYNNFLKKIVFPEYSETIEKNIKDIISKMNKENSNIVLATYEETIFNALNKDMPKKNLSLYELKYYYKSGIDNVLNDNKLLIKNNQYEIRKVNQNIPNITKSDLVKYSKSEYELNDSLSTFQLFNNNYYECYFATERQLEIPKVEFVFHFYSPNYYPCSLDNTHLLSTLTMPFIIEGLLKQYFSEYFEVANSFEVKRKLDFFYLKLILFNDTKNENYIKDLFQKIINKIFEHSNADKYLQRIGRAKFRQLLLEYSQTGIESVSKNTFEILKAIVSKLYIQPQTLLDKLLEVDSFEENFYSTFIQNIHLNVTIIGDIDRKKADNFSNIIKQKVMENHKEATEPKKNFTIKNVSDGVVYYYYSINKSPSEKQNIISIFYQIGKNSFKKFVYTKLFNICIGDIFINSLRKLRVSNVKTDLVLFNDILYYQITAYANETIKISKIDKEISLSLKQSIHEEIDKFNKFEDEVKRIKSDVKSLYRTNLYEVTEKVINRNEAPKDYNKEDGLLINVTKKTIKDYFTKKFIELPKRIGIIIFNKFYKEDKRNNDLKEFINKTHVLNPNITNNVTDNFIINPIPSKNDYEYN